MHRCQFVEDMLVIANKPFVDCSFVYLQGIFLIWLLSVLETHVFFWVFIGILQLRFWFRIWRNSALMQSTWHIQEITPTSALQNPRPYPLLAVINLASMIHYTIARVRFLTNEHSFQPDFEQELLTFDFSGLGCICLYLVSSNCGRHMLHFYNVTGEACRIKPWEEKSSFNERVFQALLVSSLWGQNLTKLISFPTDFWQK